MRRWIAASLALAAAPPQGPGVRITYHVSSPVVSGMVGGPPETGMRLGLRTDTAEVEAFFTIAPEPDSLILTADFFARRRVGRSRRGLPLWEQDDYRRTLRVAWGDTVWLRAFGGSQRLAPDRMALALVVTRAPAGGQTRPAELVETTGDDVAATLEAVLRPRRVMLSLTLVRGDTVTGPRRFDLVPDASSRTVTLGPTRAPRAFEITLGRPEPPHSARDRALALDADAVCLRVRAPGTADAALEVCGRLNNVARRLPLPGGDTLVATFTWPGAR